MSATSSSPQVAIGGDGLAVSPVSAMEIDASCRAPVLLLLLSAVGWLLLSSVLGMIGSLKFHAPGLLADCPWFTYGRVHPAHLSVLIYGFAVQAGLGVTLWMVAHLSRTRLTLVPLILAGTVLWNLGMAMGLVGILYGDSTGFEWLEMPRYAAATLFAGFLLVGLGGMVTLRERRERPLYISQWYVIAALFWFPWVFSTANILLVGKPVRGALQAAINWWYMNNLSTVWFGFIGLAAIFYFIPKIIKRPLYSHYLGIFIFWTLAIFGSWGGIPAGTPLPAWMAAMSTMAAMLTIVSTLAVLINVYNTKAENCAPFRENRALKFFLFGTLAYVVAGLAHALTSTMRVSKITNFTWFVPAQAQLVIYGFFAMTMFGAIYVIVPRLLRMEFPKQGLICGQFLLSGLGILLYAVPLMIGGIKQGLALNDATVPFLQVMTSTLMFLRISTTGDLLMALGHLTLALNLAMLLIQAGRTVAKTAWVDNTKVLEVVS